MGACVCGGCGGGIVEGCPNICYFCICNEETNVFQKK